MENSAQYASIEVIFFLIESSIMFIRSDACALQLNGQAYVVGGFDGTNIHNSVEWLDFEKQEWSVEWSFSTKYKNVFTGTSFPICTLNELALLLSHWEDQSSASLEDSTLSDVSSEDFR